MGADTPEHSSAFSEETTTIQINRRLVLFFDIDRIFPVIENHIKDQLQTFTFLPGAQICRIKLDANRSDDPERFNIEPSLSRLDEQNLNYVWKLAFRVKQLLEEQLLIYPIRVAGEPYFKNDLEDSVQMGIKIYFQEGITYLLLIAEVEKITKDRVET